MQTRGRLVHPWVRPKAGAPRERWYEALVNDGEGNWSPYTVMIMVLVPALSTSVSTLLDGLPARSAADPAGR